jgi:LPXTG-motif cell wall-anchored protein
MIPATIMMPGATTLVPGAAMATAAAAVQKGGGVVTGETDFSTLALFGLFSAILLGGTYYGLKRLNNTGGIFSRTDPKDGRERNDAPPKPHGL